MRVRWPLPCALNHSTTSLSRRRCTEVFPVGMTTRADFQNSGPRESASGASARVGSSPRSRRPWISLRECLTIVDFSLNFTRSLGADYPDQALSAPGVDNSEDFGFDAAQRNPADFPVVLTIVDALESLIQEDSRGSQERDFVLIEVIPGFGLVPLELEFFDHECLSDIMSTNVYTVNF